MAFQSGGILNSFAVVDPTTINSDLFSGLSL
jgi:hypothetical protein